MLLWVLGIYAVVLLILVVKACWDAVAASTEKRRRDAYRVARLLMVTLFGGSGLIWGIVKLYEAGVLH